MGRDENVLCVRKEDGVSGCADEEVEATSTRVSG